jgi:RNA polymerase sigma-70 factor (ECF subfamily)
MRKVQIEGVGEAIPFLQGKRDETAVRRILQAHNRRLFRLARSILRDDAEAEDVVQEAYVRGFAGVASFRGESGIGTWLGRIVINEALGRLRRRRPTIDWAALESRELGSAQVIAFPGSEQTDPEREMALTQLHSILAQAIDDLPDGFRTVFVARVIEGMSLEETAQLLDIKPETVKTRLYRANRLLRKSLGETIGSSLTEAFPFGGSRCERMTANVIGRLFPAV